MKVAKETGSGTFIGNDRGDSLEYLGIKYALTPRFCYASPVTYDKTTEYDATAFGGVCPQTRTYYEHLEVPERLFYHREFREGITYDYDEDCLNLNIYAPRAGEGHPVIIFIHGGGFNSGSVKDSSFDGAEYARRGVILVTINYRVGVLGYLTHEEIFKKFGRDGNFGLDDQLVAIRWVKEHISGFGGDPDNITLMGQSAGAISIQYLCLSKDNSGLFKRAIMMSGGGLFPKFALPRPAEETRSYWLQLMELAGCKSLEELQALDLKPLFTAIEEIKKLRKDSTFNTMPVVDGFLIKAPVDRLISEPLPIDYMLGYTNNDMYAPIMAHIGNKFANANNGYVYYFDVDAPGDSNKAFHSSELRYAFGTLHKSHRPYDEKDREISRFLIDRICAFAGTGDPNSGQSPVWKRSRGKALCFSKKGIRMKRPGWLKMVFNMLTKGEPKA
ncbi:MAG: carboxylesterase/lipase family protein [Lachnospiraceae bacterium]|nr:carboxylesterase/lipase family protein [Lachnospiraceae bacterium]